MRFAIFGNSFAPHKSSSAEHLFYLLNKMGADIYICRNYYDFLKKEDNFKLPSKIHAFVGDDFDADMVVSIGGDGTFLSAASRVGDKGIPILGINTGRLGFLSDISPEELEDTFDEINDHHHKVQARSPLQLI